MRFSLFRLNPVTAKRLKRFRSFKRAWISFWVLCALYLVSLCAEFVCNSRPLLVCHRGKFYFPVFRYYSSDVFQPDTARQENRLVLEADYLSLDADERFHEEGWMLWPLFRSSPNAQVPSSELEKYRRVNVFLTPVPGVGTAMVQDDTLTLVSFEGGETLTPSPSDGFAGHSLMDFWSIPADILDGIRRRFANEDAPQAEAVCESRDGRGRVQLRLLAYRKRRQAPKRIPIKISDDTQSLRTKAMTLRFERGGANPTEGAGFWKTLPEETREAILSAIKTISSSTTSDDSERRTYGGEASPQEGAVAERLSVDGHQVELHCELERVEHPFRPVPRHWMGLDDAGRDVLARVLYGLRTSLTFGLLLVISSMTFGTLVGCLQGYLGGMVDLLGQRMIEIWSALPFLYIVILMGSLFGAGFWLLIACYALFNWIGVSYYMRAEMLRLRRQPFVEAARCLGLPWWLIVLRHILPNALVPLVTFVPFSLVGAIGALAGLDYLGFGLPPPTPSLGQLLQQAQVQREAWWLIAYPSSALFIVMLLCVFVGEGVREAFDPRRQNRIH